MNLELAQPDEDGLVHVGVAAQKAAAEAFVLSLDDRRQELVDAEEWEILADLLEAIRVWIVEFQRIESLVEVDVHRMLPYKKASTEQVDAEKDWTGGTVHWESDRLLARLLNLWAFDPETGELTVPMADLRSLAVILGRALPLTKSLQWRVTGIRDNGLEPDDFRDRKGGRPKVITTFRPPPNPKEGPTDGG
ncbi:MAG: hypothetical protein AAFZ07_19625 [Actinomycetota bacterium]